MIVTGRLGQHGEWLGRSVRALLGQLSQAGSSRIGAGGPVQGLAELPVAKRQADIALSTADDGGAACWAELSADALLAQFPQQVWADALFPRGAARLLADPAASTLLPTLGTFRWGLAYTAVDLCDLDSVAAAIRPETALVRTETRPTRC